MKRYKIKVNDTIYDVVIEEAEEPEEEQTPATQYIEQ